MRMCDFSRVIFACVRLFVFFLCFYVNKIEGTLVVVVLRSGTPVLLEVA